MRKKIDAFFRSIDFCTVPTDELNQQQKLVCCISKTML